MYANKDGENTTNQLALCDIFIIYINYILYKIAITIVIDYYSIYNFSVCKNFKINF